MKERESIRRMLQKGGPGADFITKLVQSGKARSFEDMTKEDHQQEMLVIGGFETDIDGSKQMRCRCGALIWFAPSTLEMLAKNKRPVRHICIKCFMALMKEQKNVQ